MTIWADQLAAIYGSPIATTATLAPGSGGSALTDISIIDKTSGIRLGNDADAEVMTVTPAAVMRMKTLEDNSLTRDDLDGGTLTINSKAWRIRAHILKPNPDGELKGEVYLLLGDEDI